MTSSRPMKTLEALQSDYQYIHDRLQKKVMAFDNSSALIRPNSEMNHAAWLLGHFTWAEDTMISENVTGVSHRNNGWDQYFARLSEKGDGASLPSYDEILEHYRGVHSQNAQVFMNLKEEELFEAPKKACRYSTNIGSLIHFIEDGSYHLGQFDYLLKVI